MRNHKSCHKLFCPEHYEEIENYELAKSYASYGFKNKKHSDETKAKQSMSSMGHHRNKGIPSKRKDKGYSEFGVLFVNTYGAGRVSFPKEYERERKYYKVHGCLRG